MQKIKPPINKTELLNRAYSLAGTSLGDLAEKLKIKLPSNLQKDKGLVGQILELALGAHAGNQSLPDFPELEIELKTLPLNRNHEPQESTYICTAPINHQKLDWQNSPVNKKTKQILWIPLEADPSIPLNERKIANPILWERELETECIFKQDWQELTENLAVGNFANTSAKSGVYLQLRPKAANSKNFIKVLDQEGYDTFIVPRGFYLRANFTKKLLKLYYK